ncbi:MAG: hypothetical protein EPO51_18460 [Phenylobacterium sp.]|uniref:hypothetical protein n=1 Tax=Phenylobacterium sp. TaxID=1871053 RepID=UPI00122386B4|nr:hypothetical protein [Phenylobacterium sp.]TAJ70507.1 MAG: hypothetical protein EPO51_18460 [Phenylobacterium sp.]
MSGEKRSLPGRRWVFVLEMAAGADLLLRALAPFPVQGAEVTRVDLQTADGLARLEVETDGLASQRAEHLRARLQGLAGVRSVACGWR